MSDDNPHALPAGTRIRQYEILRVLGTGGFAHTYLAKDHNLNRLVALKELYQPTMVVRHRDGLNVSALGPSQKAKFAEAREVFIQEGRILAQLIHRAIVPVYEIFEANGTAYLVMGYVQGQEFRQWLRERGRPSEEKLQKILVALLQALEIVHRAGYMHRDLQPANILMEANDEPVLIDFGNARVTTVDKTTVMGAILTPGYAPPEQYQERSRQGPFTDLYAVGALLHLSLSGTDPVPSIDRYSADTLVKFSRQPVPGYSKKFLAAIDRAMILKPLERWQSCQAWIDALQGSAAPKKGALWLAPGATVVILILLAGGGWFYAHHRSPVVVAPPENTAAAKVDEQPAVSPAPTPKASPASATKSSPAPSTLTNIVTVAPPTPPPPPSTDPRLATKSAPYRNTLGMEFVPVTIKGGPSDGHRLLVCRHETRKGDYRQFVAKRGGSSEWENATISSVAKDGKKFTLPISGGEDHPVVNVTIDQARAFCAWLKDVESLNYRLPTDHEWSCLAGLEEDANLPMIENAKLNAEVFPWGKSFSPSGNPVGNYADETMKAALQTSDDEIIATYHDGFATTAPVKSFAVTALGLYDVGGNVSEYCDTQEDAKMNPNYWIVRGGSWRTRADNKFKKLSSSSRKSVARQFGGSILDDVGFRCVIDLDQK